MGVKLFNMMYILASISLRPFDSPNKAAGPDQLAPRLLKELADEMVTLIFKVVLWNSSILTFGHSAPFHEQRFKHSFYLTLPE